MPNNGASAAAPAQTSSKAPAVGSNLCQIFNNSQYDVTILLTSSGASTSNPYTEEAVLQTAGGTVIKANNSAWVQMNSAYVSAATQGGTVFNLVACDVKNGFYPVASFTNLSPDPTTGQLPDQTFNTASATAFSDAELFYKNFLANPNSQVCADYQTAVTNASSNPTNAETIINNFFANTQSYNTVTYDAFNAITNYYTHLPSPWTGTGATATYYLYGTSGGANPATVFVGTVTLTTPKAGVDLSAAGFGYAVPLRRLRILLT